MDVQLGLRVSNLCQGKILSANYREHEEKEKEEEPQRAKCFQRVDQRVENDLQLSCLLDQS